MTDNEIVKAKQTLNLMCRDITDLTMLEALAMAINSFDEINRQKAEIERWKKNCDELYEQMSERQKAEVEIAKRMGKAEAIKEFAERLKREKRDLFNIENIDGLIDNLVKEMVGDV